MNRYEISKLQKAEHEAFTALMFAERHYGMNDPITEAWRMKWGQIYDIMALLNVEPAELTESEVQGNGH